MNRSAATEPKAALLTHGAGSGADQPTLLAVDAALSQLGVVVRRMEFPYRRAGRRAPDRAPKLLESIRSELVDLTTELGIGPREVVLGGRSMGGRMCSMVIADGVVEAAGLVIISYPLHPPGRPDRLRTEHLPRITVPVLAVSGTRDSFGTKEELSEALAEIAGTVTTHWVDGGRHELKGTDAEVATAVAAWWTATFTRSPRRRSPRG